MSKSVLRRACAVSTAVAALAVVSSAPAQAAGKVTVKKLGTVNFRQAIADAKHAQHRPALRNMPAAKQFAALDERRHSGEEALRKSAPALKPPRVPGLPITSIEVRRGWEGLDIRDTVFSQGFEVEPPDQGLCGGTFQGTTFLWESVNLAIGLFDTQSNQYTPSALGLNALYGVGPAFDPDSGEFGPFLSDPKCYFDPDTGRWFHSILEADVDPATGALTGGANTLLAVSTSGDPLGPYNVYAIDASHAGCNLCIGDQPLIGPTPTASTCRPRSTTSTHRRARRVSSAHRSTPSTTCVGSRQRRPERRSLRARYAIHGHGAACDVAERPLRDGSGRDGVLHVRPRLRAAGLPRRCGLAENTIHVWAMTHTGRCAPLRTHDCSTALSTARSTGVRFRSARSRAAIRSASRTASPSRPWWRTTIA